MSSIAFRKPSTPAGHYPTGATIAASLAAALLVSALGGSPAAAQSATSQAAPAPARGFANPPLLGTPAGTPADRSMLLRLPTGKSHSGIERKLDLDIVYSDGTLYNPGTGVNDPVHLRSYRGTGTNPKVPFASPTIEVTPGDTVRIELHNRLPDDPSCTASTDINTPHCFNGTNLHTHGLWVSPTGNSDNVLLSINPGVNFQYEYNLPADHPSGTFWYHTHRHGSTALQVSSGMAGALVVRGDRKPTLATNGDLDTLLKTPGGKPMTERLLVLQQIQYACTNADGSIKTNADGSVNWTCNPGEVGVIESYSQFGPGSWAASGRYTSINGVVLPTFPNARAGQVERWRLIHAGVRDTISLEFRKVDHDVGPLDKLVLKAADADAFVEQHCGGAPIPYHVVASDGLTMAQAQNKTLATLQPGYRNDLLVVFPTDGKYCVVDSSAPASGNIGNVASGRQILGFVEVKGGKPVKDITRHLTDTLVAAANRNMPAAVRPSIVADLNNGLKLTRFVPHPTITDEELKGEQNLVFFIDTTTSNTKFEVGTTQADAQPYDPARVDRTLTLGDAQTWNLQAHFASHPFHIHVNPFQIVKILDPNGKDVSALASVDDAGGTVDPQYAGLKGVWKDTIWVKSLAPPATAPAGVYTVVVRTRYQRYIGEFVLHCHILDHEDQGMMQNVSIVLPDGKGGAAHTHKTH